MKTRLHDSSQYLLKLGLLLGLLVSTPALTQAAPQPHPDFNGDGHGDVAIGIPYEDVGVFVDAGVVQVIYGTPVGLRPDIRNQIFSSSECILIPDAIGGNQSGLHFGAVLAWGDFNHDGFDDLAVGLPDYNAPYAPAGMPQAGMVYVLRGSPAGLLSNPVQHFVSTNLGGPPLFFNENQEAGDRFGAALAAGDFNGDGFADLAIGVPGQDSWLGPAVADAGEVYLVYGSPAGLDRNTARGLSQSPRPIQQDPFVIHPALMDLAGDAELGDQFGSVLAAGNFNGDLFTDLVIGVADEDADAGAVHVVYGSAAGLHPNLALPNQYWRQGFGGIESVNLPDKRFGHSLAAGDFDNDGRDDLAIGAPRATVLGQALAGEVNVIYGSALGLHAWLTRPDQLWHEAIPGILDDGILNGDAFGWSLAAGDFNGDGRDDLAIGTPYDDRGAGGAFVNSAGSVHTIYGSVGGLNAIAPVASQQWYQDSPGILDVSEPNDHFGWNLTTGDFNGDGKTDLVIAVPYEDLGAAANAGAVNAIYGAAVGLNAGAGPGNQFLHQDSPFMPDLCEAGDGMGYR